MTYPADRIKHSFDRHMSDRARVLQASMIREVAELGMQEDGVIPLWFGEGAWATNPLFVDAAVDALRAGNHKYQPNNGSAALRQEICRYTSDIFRVDLDPDRVTVTPSGMQGLMLVAQVLMTGGDRVVVIEPGWPNITGAFQAMGAGIVGQPLEVTDGNWSLNMDQLIAKLVPGTKAVVINSPGNPTGWTMSAAQQRQLLDHCRRLGIWIVADDVYSRLYRHGSHAPSFLEIAEPEDLLISVNSFSKAWSMTGWRLGWIVAPVALETRLGQLTEFNSSCTAGFVQAAGIVALQQGEAEIADLKSRIQTGYDITAQRLNAFDPVDFIEPDGAFYSFFRVDGLNDSLDAAKRILHETKVGLAPGAAFGAHGEGYLRLCYAQPAEVLQQAFDRLEPFLSR
ncbi:MAG: pyridoxal phosphate-dependent aminotransferase [Pseudomonadota bacterium]